MFSVNRLYLIINTVFCFVGEKNGVKYLKIDKGIGNTLDSGNFSDAILTIWNQVFS